MGKRKNSKNMKRRKNEIRCILTHKVIGNKEVVLADSAVDYVKKQGYIVIPAYMQPIMTIFAVAFVLVAVWAI